MAGGAAAQAPWIDPPAEPPLAPVQSPPAEPHAQPPRPQPPRRAAPAEPEEPGRVQARDARGLALDYLESWSSPNGTALAETDGFYARRVVFHRRDMSARELIEEKRRFARRWPVRRYRARTDTMRVTCDPDRELCTVRLAFDFTAENAERGRRSDGTGTLELGIGFESGVPLIVEEESWVVGRGRSDRMTALEELPD